MAEVYVQRDVAPSMDAHSQRRRADLYATAAFARVHTNPPHRETDLPRARAVRSEGYAGEVDEAGEPHGEGTMRYASGHEYRGQFCSGRRDGRGTFTFPDGTEYDGGWRDGRQHGQGRLTMPSGEELTGSWWDGSMEGRGTYDEGSRGLHTRSSPWHGGGHRPRSAPPEPAGLDQFGRRMWRAFCAADTDGSGALSRREFYAALEDGGLDMSTLEKLVTWEDYDRNGDGKISWREFARVSRDLHRHGSDVPSALSTTGVGIMNTAYTIRFTLYFFGSRQ